MSFKMMAALLGGVATIPLITKSANWGSQSSSSLLQTSPTITLTVPIGNPGSITLNGIVTDAIGGDTVSYNVNGTGFIDFTDTTTTIGINNGDTLRFRANLIATFNFASVTVADDFCATGQKLIGDWVATKL